MAHRNLHDALVGEGIVASKDHYDDFWARDTFFASWGFLALREYTHVRSALDLFARYQKRNGHIPRRIDRSYVWLKYLGMRISRKIPKPKYVGAYGWAALDPNLLFVITCGKYYDATHDREMVEETFPAMRQAILWLERYERDGLLHEQIFANWMDTIVKRGHVLYTNVLYAEALRVYASLCCTIGREEEAQRYTQKHHAAITHIRARFWNGTYFDDWITHRRRQSYFASDGNALAILFGVADTDQINSIVEFIEHHAIDAVPLITNYPPYPRWRVALRMYVIGVPGYQNHHAAWTWLGAVYAVALHEHGMREKALAVHDRMTAFMNRYDVIYEIYDRSGAPYNGWFWKSARSFAWGSGLYVWMHRALHDDGSGAHFGKVDSSAKRCYN